MWDFVVHSECDGHDSRDNISSVFESAFEDVRYHLLTGCRLNSQESPGPEWPLLVEFQPSSEDEFCEEPAEE